jgi:hypothetical protein
MVNLVTKFTLESHVNGHCCIVIHESCKWTLLHCDPAVLNNMLQVLCTLHPSYLQHFNGYKYNNTSHQNTAVTAAAFRTRQECRRRHLQKQSWSHSLQLSDQFLCRRSFTCNRQIIQNIKGIDRAKSLCIEFICNMDGLAG